MNTIRNVSRHAACVTLLLAHPAYAAASPDPHQNPAELSAIGEQTDMPLHKLSLEELMRVEVATVTTASKKEEKATSAPGTVIVIDKNDIRLRGYSTLKDVLRDLPGMDLSENFFSELGTQVAVRGVTGNNRIVVLVNGMRVNPPGGEYFPFRSDFSVRDAEQIEVIYGAGSTLYGQDAISAVINVKTKTPTSEKPAVEVTVNGGLNFEREVFGSFNKVFDSARNVLLEGYIQYHDSKLTRNDLDYPRWWQDFKNVAQPKGVGTVPVRNDYGLNSFARLQAGGFSIQSWYRSSERSSSEGYGPPILGFLPQAKWVDRSWVTEAGYLLNIADNVTLNSTVTYNWYQVDPKSRYIFPQDERHWFYNDFKYANGTSLSFEETLRVNFSKSLSALLGGTYTRYDIIPKSTIPGGAHPGSDDSIIRQGGSFVYYTEAGNPASRQEIPRAVVSKFNRYGAYLEFGWQITPKLKAIAGGRVDKDTRIEQVSRTPRGGVIYDITDSITAKYTYSWAYISPAPYFGFATYDRGDILNTSNPALQPETSKTHEVNLTYNKEAVNLGLSLYYGQQSNLILVSDVDSPPNVVKQRVFVDLAGTQPRTLTQTVNSGTSHNGGLDFYGKAKLTRSLSTWFSYSYTSFEEVTAGTTSGLKGISQNNFRLGATWAVTPKLFVTPSLVARSTPQHLNAGNLQDELHNPWEANLFIVYTPTSYMDWYIDLRNVTNNHYALTGFLPYAIPQETFNGVLGIRFTF